VFYIRISLMMPEKGKRDEVRRLNQEISAFNRGLEGCRDSFVISAADNSGELGRVSVWESKEAAEGAANDQHHMSLRSELHLAIQPGHSERSFFTA
jgi:quinol monooxygenase YgiN